MSDEPDSLVLRHLRDIRATQDEHSMLLQALPRIEKQIADLSKVVTYSLGQSTETQFRQVQQEQRIDDVFDKLEELFSKPKPV